MVAGKADNPNLPLTVEEIVADAVAVWRLGSSIVHLHARGADGAPTWDPSVYAEIISGIRENAPGMIVCASTSGRLWGCRDKRGAVLRLEGKEKPDMASLALGSMNFPRGASVSEPGEISHLAELMYERKIVPELEAFDLGMVDYASHLAEIGALTPPLYFNLILGNRGTAAADPANLAYLTGRLPEGSLWAACGIGSSQFPMNRLAIEMGGHVRVGLEDNLNLEPGRQASNAELVERVVAYAASFGRSPMTAADARKLLGITPA